MDVPDPISGENYVIVFPMTHLEPLEHAALNRDQVACSNLLIGRIVLRKTEASFPHDALDLSIAVELPAQEKRRLTLDDERSWIICEEYNRFAWPNAHVLPVERGKDKTWNYGQLSRSF